MTAATKRLTFEEDLKYDDGTDTQYELVDGELIPMSLGTGKHGGISKFLERTFDDESAKMGKNWTAQKFSVGIRSPRGGRWDTSRIPDVVVLPIEQWEALFNREAIIERERTSPHTRGGSRQRIYSNHRLPQQAFLLLPSSKSPNTGLLIPFKK